MGKKGRVRARVLIYLARVTFFFLLLRTSSVTFLNLAVSFGDDLSLLRGELAHARYVPSSVFHWPSDLPYYPPTSTAGS